LSAWIGLMRGPGCRSRAAFADKREVQSGFERLIP
jgi:hypothetical protein